MSTQISFAFQNRDWLRFYTVKRFQDSPWNGTFSENILFRGAFLPNSFSFKTENSISVDKVFKTFQEKRYLSRGPLKANFLGVRAKPYYFLQVSRTSAPNCLVWYKVAPDHYYLLTNWIAYLYGRIQSPRPDVMPDRREGITRAAGFVFACTDTQAS